jgi:trans-aconitate 2-methyltransferase
VLDHPRLFRSLYRALKPGGWLVAQCGGGPTHAHLLQRAAGLMASDLYTPYFSGWAGPWELATTVTTAERLRAAGFTEIETSLEPAPTVLGGDEEYREFLASVIFREHLARVRDEALRARFIAALSEAAAQDDPPYALDYWYLNLRARRGPADAA